MKTNFSKYPPVAIPGVINHQFINASDAPGQYEAEQCNRQAVTAQWLFDHPDVVGHFFLADDADLGLDPWRVIEGCDALRDGSKIILEYGRTGDKHVDPDFVVYVSRREALTVEPSIRLSESGQS